MKWSAWSHYLGAVCAVSLIAQPVAEIYALDHGGSPLMTVDKGQGLEDIFNIAMAPVLAFNCRDGCDVSGPKGMYLWEYEEQSQQNEARVEEGHGVLI